MRLNGNLVFNAGGTSASGEIQNAYIERLASNPSFSADEKGRLIFRTDAALYYYNDGVTWVPFATGGNAALLQSEVDKIELTLGSLVNTDGTSNVAAALSNTVFGAATDLTTALNNMATYINGNNELAELDDVALAGLVTGQYLKYNSTSSKWENDTLTLSDVTNVTVPAAELNLLFGLTATASELNILDGALLSTAELNILDGATLSTNELNYVDGVTSSIQNQLDGKQPVDATLTALAGLSGTGIVVETGVDTFTHRSLTQPAAGITIADANGVAGNPTFALANDLAAVEGLASTGYSVRTADGVWTTRQINGFAGRTIVTNGDGITTNTDIDLAEVTNSNTGTFLKLTRDTYGRVTGTEAVTTGDITALVDTTYVDIAGDTMTGNLVMTTGRRITLPDAPANDTDAANKAYVDAVAAGLSWKQAVNVATTGNITLSGTQTIDGVAVLAGDRVLVKNQTNPKENGIYVAAAGAWARATNMDAAAEFLGATVFILAGTINDNSGWTQTATVVAVGTDPVIWSQFSGSNTYTWGTGLAATGNTVNVLLGAGIAELPGDEVGVDIVAGKAVQLTSTATGGQVTFVLDGAGLEQSASGLKISTAGVTNVMLANSSFSVNADAGTVDPVALGETLLFAGTSGQGISTAVAANAITITAANASASQKGVATFDATEFTVTSGNVVLGTIGNSKLANSTVTITGTSGSDTVALGESMAFIGGAGGEVSTAMGANSLAISVRDATTGQKGVASFNSAQFSVSSGAVSLAATLADLTNVSGDGSIGDVLRNIAGIWTPISLATLAGAISLSDLSDVSATDTDGHMLVGTGTGWTNQKVYHLETVAVAATSWTVAHGIGQKFCTVTVVDSTDEVIIPQSIKFDSTSQLTVTFSSAITGKVVVMGVA